MTQKKRFVGQFLIGIITASLLSCGGSSSSPPEVTIDLSHAKALFTVSSSSTPVLTLKDATSEEALGTLRKIVADGTVKPVIYKGRNGQEVASDVLPTKVFVGADQKIYITFWSPISMDGKTCCMVRGMPEGRMECDGFDNGFSSYELSCDSNSITDQSSQSFDRMNNFYFPGRDNNFSNISIKKLSPEGVVTTALKFEEASVGPFAVSPDGTLIFKSSPGGFRKTTPTGGVANLPVINELDFILSSGGDIFVDQNGRLARLLQNSGWETSESILPPSPSALALSDLPGLVTTASSHRGFFTEDTSGNIYWYQSNSIGYQLSRIYPGTPVVVTPSDNRLFGPKIANNLLYYPGTDASNKNIFRRIDLSNPSFPVTDLIPPGTIEVYRFTVRSNGNVLFGGLRLSDRQLIIGEIDVTTLAMTVTTTTTTRIDELVLIQ